MVRLSLSLCGRTQTWSDLVCLCVAGHKHCQTQSVSVWQDTNIVRLSLSLCGSTQTWSDLVCLCVAARKHGQT